MAKLTKAQRLHERAKRAKQAARNLRDLATECRVDGVLHHTYFRVDPSVLLGTALTQAPALYLAFDVLQPTVACATWQIREPKRVKVRRQKLVQARQALRGHLRLGTVEAWIDTDGVHLRWKDRQGGLDFLDASTAYGHEQRRLEDCFAVDLQGAAREKAA